MVDSGTYGSIDGVVQHDSSLSPIAGVSVSTSPATEALVTGEDGRFLLSEIPTGNYSITVNKNGYKRSTVNVSVREDDTTNATILLSENNSDASNDTTVSVNITNWWNETTGDSVDVHVEYMVENTGTVDINQYEITFRIKNPDNEFFHNEEGEQLQVGRNHVGEFRKYVRSSEATEVEVHEKWVESTNAQGN